MTIDWSAFTPQPALVGGVLIGCAAALLVLTIGRVAGISGIIGGLLRARAGDRAWRVAFLAGLMLSPWAFFAAGRAPTVAIDASYSLVAIAGVIVGVGTRYGGGCTSGHGVCGVSRLSPRSLVATLAFMIAGFVTVFAVRHVIGS